MDEYLRYHISKPKLYGLLAISVLFVATGIWMTVAGDGPVEKILGLMCAVFFGMSFFVFPQRLSMDDSVVTFGPEGIEDKRMGVGVIPWEEIVSVGTTQVKSSKFLALYLRDPQMYQMQLPWNLRLFSGLNKYFGYSSFSITFADVTPGIDDALAYVRHFHPDKMKE